MPHTYNLIDEPWIPVRVRGKPSPRDVSLREALLRAHEIERLIDPSPIVTAALHRLLIALAHAAIAGPADEDAWAAEWARGRFEASVVEAYLGRFHARFDLFDAARPFYQSAGLPIQVASTVARLGHEYSRGNNSLLFDHSFDSRPPRIEPDAAARLLVTVQAFSLPGTITILPGDPTGSSASHLVKAAVVLLQGATLFETLLLNMVDVDGIRGRPFQFDPAEDAPAWERDEPVTATTRAPAGYLDLLTWQSRRVLLVPDDDGMVRRTVIMAGFGFPPGLDPHDYETMAAFVQRDKLGWVPVGFRPEKALWRDSVALLQSTSSGTGPSTVRWLGHLKAGYLDEDLRFDLTAFGLSTDRAKVFLWRAEEFPLPLAYVDNAELLPHLEHGLESAKEAASALFRATRVLAEQVLSPQGNGDPARIRAFGDSLGAERAFWPALDLPFRAFIRDVPTARVEAKAAWAASVRSAAEDAFERAARIVEETPGRGHRAVAEAAPRFEFALHKALARLLPEPVPGGGTP